MSKAAGILLSGKTVENLQLKSETRVLTISMAPEFYSGVLDSENTQEKRNRSIKIWKEELMSYLLINNMIVHSKHLK